jgi:signal-transduction protein with cAMP-binding, CBS, and nucleotidyltransferase domain
MNEFRDRWQEPRDMNVSYGMTQAPLQGMGPSIDSPSLGGCGPVFEFMGCWFDLYKNMGAEELDVFNSILRSETFYQQTPLICQGMSSNRLYFINRGTARMVYLEDGSRFIGPDSGMGHVVGADTFFDGSQSRYSVMAVPGTQVDYLEKDDVMETFGFVPGLIGKLRRFCLDRDRALRESRMDIMEKRTQKRYTVTGLAAAKLLDSEGLPTGKPFRGELLDISEGGFSFSIRLTRDQAAKQLQGRSIVSLIKLEPSRPGEDVFWGGRIVQVRKRDDMNYTVHLKGDAATNQLSEVLRKLDAH